MKEMSYETVDIEEEINVPSSLLDKNVETNVLNFLRENKIGKIIKQHGIIENIVSVEIIDTLLSGTNNFKIVYKARVYTPQINKREKGVILCSADNRLFLEIRKKYNAVIDNGIGRNNRYTFSTCNCSFDTSNNEHIDNILIKKVEFIDGSFYANGQHIHFLKENS